MTSSGRLEVNVFDRYFFGAPSCVKGKSPALLNYVFRRQNYDGISLFVDVCMYEEARSVNSKYKIGWLLEARGLHPGDYERAEEALGWLDFILTYDRQLLERQRFVQYVKGGTWIPPDQWGAHPKTKWCSMLYGSKTVPMEGYKVRHEVAEIARKLGVDVYFEIGRNPEAKVRAMRDYMFTIVVDACRQDNCFSENLLDPIMLGCVPIYWGCPNISDFLNTEPFLFLDEASKLPLSLKRATRSFYNEVLDSLMMNQRIAQKWEITEDWIALHALMPFLREKEAECKATPSQ